MSEMTETLYRIRCGYCGAPWGELENPDAPCEGTITTGPDGEPMLGGPHREQYEPVEVSLLDAVGEPELLGPKVSQLLRVLFPCQGGHHSKAGHSDVACGYCGGSLIDPRKEKEWRSRLRHILTPLYRRQGGEDE